MPLFSLASIRGKFASRKSRASQANVKGDALSAPVAATSKEEMTLTFRPGRLGWTIDGNRIVKVAEGSQAATQGVQADWAICSVDGQSFVPGVEDAIDVKSQGDADFAVTFRRKDGPTPMCPGCRNSMVWSSYSGGAYAKGWTCCNFNSCGCRNMDSARSRWFCGKCQNDFCSECYAAPVVEDSPASIIGAVLARLAVTVLLLWTYGRRCKRRCAIQRAASTPSSASNQRPAARNALAEAKATQVPVCTQAGEVAADASSSPWLLTWPRLLFIGLFSRSIVVVLLLWSYSRKLGRRLKIY